MKRQHRYLARLESQPPAGRKLAVMEFIDDGTDEAKEMVTELDMWWVASATGQVEHVRDTSKRFIPFTLPNEGGYKGEDAYLLYEGTRTFKSKDPNGFVIVARLFINGADSHLRYRIHKMPLEKGSVPPARLRVPPSPLPFDAGEVPAVFQEEIDALDRFLRVRAFELELERKETRERLMALENSFVETSYNAALLMDAEAIDEQGPQWTGPMRRDFVIDMLRRAIMTFYHRMRDSGAFSKEELVAAGNRFNIAFTYYTEAVLEQLEEQYPGQIRTGEYADDAEITPPDLQQDKTLTPEDKARIDKAQEKKATPPQTVPAAKKKTGRERELEELLKTTGPAARTPTPPGARRKKMKPLTPEEQGAIDARLPVGARARIDAQIASAAHACVEKIASLLALADKCAAIGCHMRNCPSQCKRCKKTAYCSRECQVSDWHARHHKMCNEAK
jgi:hypothetical protein